MGLIRKKYPKEASVFRVRIPASPFIRNDYSFDLYKARNEVVAEVQRIVGEVRDFNGGMIAKQNELLIKLKESLGEIDKHQEFLLENFFHSLFPIEIRSVTDCELLKKLFLLLLELISPDNNETQNMIVKGEENRLFMVVSLQEISLKETIFEVMEKYNISPAQLITLDLQMADAAFLGYIYCNDDPLQRELFLHEIQSMGLCRSPATSS